MAKHLDLVDLLTRLDTGELNEEEEIDLFQYLVDSGAAWTLQGRIGRQAVAMLQAGVIGPANRQHLN